MRHILASLALSATPDTSRRSSPAAHDEPPPGASSAPPSSDRPRCGPACTRGLAPPPPAPQQAAREGRPSSSARGRGAQALGPSSSRPAPRAQPGQRRCARDRAPSPRRQERTSPSSVSEGHTCCSTANAAGKPDPLREARHGRRPLARRRGHQVRAPYRGLGPASPSRPSPTTLRTTRPRTAASRSSLVHYPGAPSRSAVWLSTAGRSLRPLPLTIVPATGARFRGGAPERF